MDFLPVVKRPTAGLNPQREHPLSGDVVTQFGQLRVLAPSKLAKVELKVEMGPTRKRVSQTGALVRFDGVNDGRGALPFLWS